MSSVKLQDAKKVVAFLKYLVYCCYIMEITAEIVKLLHIKKMTRRQLAEKLDVGYSTFYNALNGYTTTPKATVLLAKAYKYLKSRNKIRDL